MALSDFLVAARRVANDVAAQYGLSADELYLLALTAAGLEGGLGETAGVGDNGHAFGRFQFNNLGGWGSTYEAQGLTPQEYGADEFQAKVFIPHLAKNLAAVKAAGYTGGEAIRQAVFQAERPADMYPASRFNSAVSAAYDLVGGKGVGTVGDTTVSAQSAGYGDASLDGEYQAIYDRWKTAHDGWVKAGQPTDGAEADAYLSAQMDLSQFVSTFGKPKTTVDSAKDAAQQAFENSLAQGQLDLSRANSAFQRWYQKTQAAQGDAANQLADVRNKNAEIADMNKAIESSYMPGLQPLPTKAQYVSAPYPEVLAKYKAQYGVNDQGPADVASTGPSVLNGSGEGLRLPDTQPPLPPMSPAGRSGAGASADIWDANVGQGAAYSPWKTSRGSDSPMNYEMVNGKLTRKQAKRWWQKIPGFASGVQDFAGGPAVVGEQGPEIVDIPGLGQITVGQQGAEQVNLPAGANVIPLQEKYLFERIRQAAAQARATDQDQQAVAASQRRNDPQLQEKVLASLQQALAAYYAMDPPPTPMLGPGAVDMWANWRGLTGVPAVAQGVQ